VNDQLSTIAEVAIGLAGFASLATVLRNHEKVEALVALQRLLVLLFLSLSVVFLSLLPPLLTGAGLSYGTAWRLAGSCLAIFVLFTLSPWSPLSRNLQKVRSAGYARPQLYRDWSAYPVAMAAAVGITLALGLVADAAPSAYVAALAMLLLTAAVQFVRLITSLITTQAV
jgi:hypothetical protein